MPDAMESIEELPRGTKRKADLSPLISQAPKRIRVGTPKEKHVRRADAIGVGSR